MKILQNWRVVLAILLLVSLSLSYFYFKDRDRKEAEGDLSDRQPSPQVTGSTISQSKALNLANKLEAAMKGLGTNEEAVNAAISEAKTDQDLRDIDTAFGIRRKHSLGAWLSSDGYLDEVQDLIRDKGLYYTFPIIDKRAFYEF